ncbi:aldo/keto reductase [Wenxinia saemankumensis]|uniref:Predicted oxidoreductase n=1 Tax=Wenxinia saemankumensis TaxID=1447782 RepID=A0A1M6CS14_9RHOB|nr:aldo/keto reductase [Wenxinia saemankumensis]SHI63885.1 Predicted oxidoreductase [Wenxinia saemankumensis]
MDRVTLGRDGLEVSAWCLGTMTWGNQTEQDDAHRQIDMALDHGIDFLDTAEMYPVAPVRAETVGRTERIIGNWIERTHRRDELVIATKVSGPDNPDIRDGEGYSGANIRACVEASLRRLRTDVIDLYQLHWPARRVWAFRRNWSYRPSSDRAKWTAHMEEVLAALGDLQREGKIRAFGLSNETAWGLTRWCDLAEGAKGPRAVAIQNEYSLLARLYDTDLAEVSAMEGVTLLAYSPLAAGFLTGKYQGGKVPKGSRRSLVDEMGGRMSARVLPAVAAYLDLAERHGLDPVHMALAWTVTRPFPVVPIFGATTTPQLERILQGTDLSLPKAVLDEIDEVHKSHPMPF